MNAAHREPGSFRDPKGRIYYVGDRVLRTVTEAGLEDFNFVRSTGLIGELIAGGLLIEETEVDTSIISESDDSAVKLIEHPRLPFVSYPYEWGFESLKAAALLHLDIQQKALAKDVALSDASAYNIQFRGCKPVFIDALSFRQYHDGEFWSAHRQFCEQFVNPLLLRSELGVPHNAWFRGALEGISAVDMASLLPWRSRLSWNILTNVFLQARLQGASSSAENASKTASSKRLPKLGFDQMLHGLRQWISKLQPRKSDASVWGDYAASNSYVDEEAQKKQQFVAEFANAVRPELLFDIGCNTGDYTVAALAAGAKHAVGFDFDLNAVDYAFARARAENLEFLPLHLDVANQSPAQGWRELERKGLGERAHADGVIALAVVHHLVVAKNLPLGEVLDWIVDMAPQGVIEFVPKSDPMVQRLLSLREDIFDDYTEDSFRSLLSARCEVIKSSVVSKSGRTMYWFKR
jgi:ribosomal protein L11 methylase PrmA